MRTKKLLTMLLAGVFLSTSIMLAGCSKKEETTKPGTEQSASKIDADQTINIIGYDYSSLDPAAVSDHNSFTTLGNVMEGLMTETLKDGKVVNVLTGAKEMKKNADGTVYTFTLRDAKWSDGKDVTAQDYAYSWKRLVDPKTAAEYQGFLEEIGVKGAAEIISGKAAPDTLGVKAVDAKTFEVTLAQPTPYFESALTFKGLVPLREDIVKAQADKFGQDFKTYVYNGPFVVTEYAKGSKIVYKKNEKYWDAASVKLQTANGFIVNEPATIVKMFEAKELDMAGATGDDLSRLTQRATTGEFLHVKGNEPSVFYFVFNTQSKILSNAKVRLALSLSYDRAQQINVVWKRHIAGTGIVTPKITLGDKEYRSAVPEPLKDIKEDPKKLLSEGLKELGLPDDPSKVELKLLNSQASATTKAQSEFIQNQWQKNLGIKLNIEYAADSPSYFAARNKGQFDICSGGWGADYNDVASFFMPFMTGNGNNSGKYSNKEFDDLVKKASSTLDSAKRYEYYKQAEQILVAKDAAVSPYFYKDVNSFQHNYLKGMYLPLFGAYYDLRNAYVQGKK